jgi:hypothetical protein
VSRMSERTDDKWEFASFKKSNPSPRLFFVAVLLNVFFVWKFRRDGVGCFGRRVNSQLHHMGVYYY